MQDSQVEAVFSAALNKKSGAERAAYLEGACSDDSILREKVEVLLSAHDEAGNFLKPPPTEDTAGPESVGQVIGRYKLLQEIGEGGFGVVYMAEQLEPVRRKVALKIIKLGMDTKQVVARFESERQALALMDHPNIARVLDAGATEKGRPYFVMELVRGIPISEYCDKNNLSARERLEIFTAVCRAVQHAHQKGIIHRDLKPSNVLVTLHDGQPVPKVIDFGIAEATNQRLTERTLFTEYQQFIGTPQYMSPEQAEMSGLDIDTRSDIYSLGVLLYELLTGTTPFDAEMLREAGYGELQRIIREQEPPSPSVRVSTLQDLATVARNRRSEPETLSRLIRGELDWIVMKALEKDRTRRYETPKELAADVERFLMNEPVMAGPPSTVYRLRKFVYRHRVAAMMVGLVAAVVLIGLGTATAGFLKAHRERAHSQAVADFLQEMLASVDPHEAEERDLDVASVLERTRALFGHDHSTVAAILSSLALQLQHSGNVEDAEPLYDESLRIWRGLHGDQHVNIGTTLTRLGRLYLEKGDDVAAERALREGLAITKDLPGPGRFASCDTRFELAQLLSRRGKYAEAETLLKDTIELRREQGTRENFLLGTALEQLTHVLTSLGKTEEASQCLDETFTVFIDIYAPDSLRAGTLNSACGTWFRQHGDMEKAEPHLREAVRIYRLHENPPRDYYMAALDGLLSIVIMRPDATDETIEVFKELVYNMRLSFGSDYQRITSLLFGFAKELHKRDRSADAIPFFAEGITLSRRALGDDWEAADKRTRQLAELTWPVGITGGSTQEQYESALVGAQTLTQADPDTQSYAGLVGIINYRLGRFEEAVELLQPRAAVPGRSFDVHDVLRERAFLAMSRFRLGQTEQAREALAKVREMMENPVALKDELNRAVVEEAEALVSPALDGD